MSTLTDCSGICLQWPFHSTLLNDEIKMVFANAQNEALGTLSVSPATDSFDTLLYCNSESLYSILKISLKANIWKKLNKKMFMHYVKKLFSHYAWPSLF